MSDEGKKQRGPCGVPRKPLRPAGMVKRAHKTSGKLAPLKVFVRNSPTSAMSDLWFQNKRGAPKLP